MNEALPKSLGSHEGGAPSQELGPSGSRSEPSLPESSTAASDAQSARPSDAQPFGRASQPLDESSAASSATQSDRRADGTFAPGNTASLKHGGYRSLDRPDIAI